MLLLLGLVTPWQTKSRNHSRPRLTHSFRLLSHENRVTIRGQGVRGIWKYLHRFIAGVAMAGGKQDAR